MHHVDFAGPPLTTYSIQAWYFDIMSWSIEDLLLSRQVLGMEFGSLLTSVSDKVVPNFSESSFSPLCFQWEHEKVGFFQM